MSILIKGMEMPKSCAACNVKFCDGRRTVKHFAVERSVDCPLVPVPPHGRLIDADALWAEINKICDRRDAVIITDLTCCQQILSAVRHAPPIIPAEED